MQETDMTAKILIGSNEYSIDLGSPIDLSIPLRTGSQNPKCFFAPNPQFEPLKAGDFIGDTEQGGAVNFKNVFFNPHGNGTHTETAWHVSSSKLPIGNHLGKYHFFAQLMSCKPQEQENGDLIITSECLDLSLLPQACEALIIRTLPNELNKITEDYSGKNPAYMSSEAAASIVKCGINHLLIDLPSVDREEDGGRLLSHNMFFGSPEHRPGTTITEMIYVPEEVPDGGYLLFMQIPNFELDAAPCRPVLYQLNS
jgi:kynurenine formamidase